MYFREVYDLDEARLPAFARTYREAYAPHLERLGFKPVLRWETVPLQDSGAQFIALWRFEQPEQPMQLSRALDDPAHGDPALRQARLALSGASRRREGWSLLAQQPHPTIEEQLHQVPGLSLCLLEEVDLVANHYELYHKALRINFSRLIEGTGARLLAVFRPQLYSVKAEVLWGFADGWASLERFAAIERHPEWPHWQAIAQAVRSGARGRLLRVAP